MTDRSPEEARDEVHRRRVRTAFSPQHVGMVVNGYGVPHAHWIIVPQHGPHDITSARYARLDNGQIASGMENIPVAPRSALDQHARLLSAAFDAAP